MALFHLVSQWWWASQYKAAVEGITLERSLVMLEKISVCNVEAAQHSHPKKSVKRSFKCDVCQSAYHPTHPDTL